MHGGSFSSTEKCAATIPTFEHVPVFPKLKRLTPWESARRDIAAIGKRVEEISGGMRGDFDKLMGAAFGRECKRYWEFARDVFRDSTTRTSDQ